MDDDEDNAFKNSKTSANARAFFDSVSEQKKKLAERPCEISMTYFYLIPLVVVCFDMKRDGRRHFAWKPEAIGTMFDLAFKVGDELKHAHKCFEQWKAILIRRVPHGENEPLKESAKGNREFQYKQLMCCYKINPKFQNLESVINDIQKCMTKFLNQPEFKNFYHKAMESVTQRNQLATMLKNPTNDFYKNLKTCEFNKYQPKSLDYLLLDEQIAKIVKILMKLYHKDSYEDLPTDILNLCYNDGNFPNDFSLHF